MCSISSRGCIGSAGSSWDYSLAALQGSSFYKLPKVLQWFSGNIGFHHIHHLSPRIPNYNLEKCHRAEPLFQTVKPVTLFSSFKSFTFRLWDEQRRQAGGLPRVESDSKTAGAGGGLRETRQTRSPVQGGLNVERGGGGLVPAIPRLPAIHRERGRPRPFMRTRCCAASLRNVRLANPWFAAKNSLRMAIKSRIWLSVIFLASVLLSPAAPMPTDPKPYTGKGLAPAYLRCEYLIDPLGIDEPAPRLSWIVESGERGQRQTACHILVASTERLLRQGQGDLWDTGKVASEETIGTAYHGQALVSHQRCFWKVKVWDKDGRESAWSKPAMWSMGLLQARRMEGRVDWLRQGPPRRHLRKPRWAEPNGSGMRRMRRARCRSAGACSATRSPCRPNAKVKQAEVCASADDAMRFALNGHVRVITEAKDDSWRRARKGRR